jgi:hypothetical protein
VELVVRGLVRVHARAHDGRTLTVRYCRTGAIMGVMSLYADPFVMPAGDHRYDHPGTAPPDARSLKMGKPL